MEKELSGATAVRRAPTVWKKHYALPPEHGAWFWFLGPLLLGVAAAGRLTPDLALLAIAALAAFLVRQPVTLLVKVASGRRGRADREPALFWIGAYGAIALAAVAGLVLRGHEHILWLVLPALPIFGLFLYLVTRKEERGQMWLEIAGAVVLALTAPAAYWVCDGTGARVGWILWGIMGLYIAASIVETYLRLVQRRMKALPTASERWRSAMPALTFHAINAVAFAGLAAFGWVPWATPIAFAGVLAASLEGTQRPPVGAKPSRIGIRQLVVGVAFVVIVAAGYCLAGS